MARALDADGQASKVALLEISVDPHRDTPARLRAYQQLYGGPLPDWTLLRATPADTAKLWKFFDVEYQRVKEPKPASIDWLTHKPLTYDVTHSDALIFLGADGHEQVHRQRRTRRRKARYHPAARPVPRPVRAQIALPPVTRSTTGPSPKGSQVFSWLTQHRLHEPAS